ncbi:MAG: HAD-IA family hydrolase [Xanthobacteraceae bacterium]
MPLRAVFFDVGETLINETRLYHGWADIMGVDRDEFLAVLDDVIASGGPHRQVFDRQRPGFDVRAAAEERRRAGKDFRIEARDLYEDARPCLQALAGQGWYIGIAGNQPRSARATLETFDLGARVIATSAELGVDKPSPDFFGRISELAAIDPTDILYVGDRVDNDVIPAKRFGMKAVLLERGPWGRNHARLPDASLADYRIKHLSELPAQLAGLLG